jgi:uncharacterized membrane protein
MDEFESGVDRTAAAPPVDEIVAGVVASDVDAAVVLPPRTFPFSRRPTDEEAGYESGWLADVLAEEPGPEPVPSVAAIGGHPLHPMVVPLPIGAFVAAFWSDISFARSGDPFWSRAAWTLTRAGVVTGSVAALLGALDFLGREQVRRIPAAWVHAGGNLAIVGLGIARLRAGRDIDRGSDRPRGLMLSATAAMILAITGWLGGELAYRHRIGVVPFPEA